MGYDGAQTDDPRRGRGVNATQPIKIAAPGHTLVDLTQVGEWIRAKTDAAPALPRTTLRILADRPSHGPGWLEIQKKDGADAYAYYNSASGTKRTTPPNGAPDYYRMETEEGDYYYWYGPTGETTWDQPDEPFWTEVKEPEKHLPELKGRRVCAWSP